MRRRALPAYCRKQCPQPSSVLTPPASPANLKLLLAVSKGFEPPASLCTSHAPASASSVLPQAMPTTELGADTACKSSEFKAVAGGVKRFRATGQPLHQPCAGERFQRIAASNAHNRARC